MPHFEPDSGSMTDSDIATWPHLIHVYAVGEVMVFAARCPLVQTRAITARTMQIEASDGVRARRRLRNNGDMINSSGLNSNLRGYLSGLELLRLKAVPI